MCELRAPNARFSRSRKTAIVESIRPRSFSLSVAMTHRRKKLPVGQGAKEGKRTAMLLSQQMVSMIICAARISLLTITGGFFGFSSRANGEFKQLHES